MAGGETPNYDDPPKQEEKGIKKVTDFLSEKNPFKKKIEEKDQKPEEKETNEKLDDNQLVEKLNKISENFKGDSKMLLPALNTEFDIYNLEGSDNKIIIEKTKYEKPEKRIQSTTNKEISKTTEIISRETDDNGGVDFYLDLRKSDNTVNDNSDVESPNKIKLNPQQIRSILDKIDSRLEEFDNMKAQKEQAIQMKNEILEISQSLNLKKLDMIFDGLDAQVKFNNDDNYIGVELIRNRDYVSKSFDNNRPSNESNDVVFNQMVMIGTDGMRQSALRATGAYNAEFEGRGDIKHFGINTISSFPTTPQEILNGLSQIHKKLKDLETIDKKQKEEERKKMIDAVGMKEKQQADQNLESSLNKMA